MKIGIMGGTFDPIHRGHLEAAKAAYSGAQLDEVWFMPSQVPPLKAGAPSSSSEDRLQMIHLALARIEAFDSCDLELHRQGVSYSYDTVMQLRQSLSEDVELYWIIGADRLDDLLHWYRIEELAAALNGFIAVNRGGMTSSTQVQLERLPEWLHRNIHCVTMDCIELSSTTIRERLRRGESVAGDVPDEVIQYIQTKGLYKS